MSYSNKNLMQGAEPTFNAELPHIIKCKGNAIEPSHYTDMKISPLEYIVSNNLGWNVGNVIKYVSRYKNKNGIEDLKKAQWYLKNLIDALQEQDNAN